MVQEDDDYSDVVFTQLKAVRKVQLDQPHQDPLRNKVISMLKSKGAKMNSAVLSVMPSPATHAILILLTSGGFLSQL